MTTIDHTAAHIADLEMRVITQQAEIDTLRRRLALAEAGIDFAGEYNAGAALGMAIPSEARDIGFGVPVV